MNSSLYVATYDPHVGTRKAADRDKTFTQKINGAILAKTWNSLGSFHLQEKFTNALVLIKLNATLKCHTKTMSRRGATNGSHQQTETVNKTTRDTSTHNWEASCTLALAKFRTQKHVLNDPKLANQADNWTGDQPIRKSSQ